MCALRILHRAPGVSRVTQTSLGKVCNLFSLKYYISRIYSLKASSFWQLTNQCVVFINADPTGKVFQEESF